MVLKSSVLLRGRSEFPGRKLSKYSLNIMALPQKHVFIY